MTATNAPNEYPPGDGPDDRYPPDLDALGREAYDLCARACAHDLDEHVDQSAGPDCNGLGGYNGYCGGCPNCIAMQIGYSYLWSRPEVREYWTGYAKVCREVRAEEGSDAPLPPPEW